MLQFILAAIRLFWYMLHVPQQLQCIMPKESNLCYQDIMEQKMYLADGVPSKPECPALDLLPQLTGLKGKCFFGPVCTALGVVFQQINESIPCRFGTGRGIRIIESTCSSHLKSLGVRRTDSSVYKCSCYILFLVVYISVKAMSASLCNWKCTLPIMTSALLFLHAWRGLLQGCYRVETNEAYLESWMKPLGQSSHMAQMD